MKRLFLSLSGIIFLGMCVSCAAPQSSSAPGPYASAKSGKGVVYFYRDLDDEMPASRQVVFTVKQNGHDIGTLDNGTYFYHYVKPGRHYFSISRSYPSRPSDRGAGRFIEVKPDERYYMQAIPQIRNGEVTADVFVTFPDQAVPTIDNLALANETY